MGSSSRAALHMLQTVVEVSQPYLCACLMAPYSLVNDNSPLKSDYEWSTLRSRAVCPQARFVTNGCLSHRLLQTPLRGAGLPARGGCP